MSTLFNNETSLDITPYLSILVERDGADIFLHMHAVRAVRISRYGRAA